jgi:hypothetical protein
MVERNEDGTFADGHEGIGGRKKNPYSLTKFLREKGEEVMPDGRTRAQMLSDKLWSWALDDGDKGTAQNIFNRLEGMPKERVESETRTVTQIQLVTDDEVSGPPKTEAADTKPD